jgi:hypothetical protein
MESIFTPVVKHTSRIIHPLVLHHSNALNTLRISKHLLLLTLSLLTLIILIAIIHLDTRWHNLGTSYSSLERLLDLQWAPRLINRSKAICNRIRLQLCHSSIWTAIIDLDL